MILQSWLTQLCRMIPNVQSAIVFETLEITETSTPSAMWPDDQVNVPYLSRACALLKKQSGPVIILGDTSIDGIKAETDQQTSDSLVIAYPLIVNNLDAVVIVELKTKYSQQNVILQLLNWGKDWLNLLLKDTDKPVGKVSAAGSSKAVLHKNQSTQALNPNIHLIQLVLNCNSLHESYLALVSEIANVYNFNRVWLGESHERKVDLKTLSNTASFDTRTNLAKHVRNVMEEANSFSSEQVLNCNQEALDNGCFSSEHSLNSLLSENDTQSVLAFPLQQNHQRVGVLLCESTQNITVETIEEITSLLAIITPLIALKKQASSSIPEQFKKLTKDRFLHLLQGKLSQFQIVLISFIIIIFLTSIIQTEHRVAANATLEGRIQRAVVAPFDGYIKHAFIRAGENVKEGELIAQLDDQELTLEKKRLLSQKEELDKEYRKELAALNQAKIRIIKTQVAQLDVQLDLLESKHKRTQLLSPLSGIIVEGDLSRSIGSPVKQGQILFEVSPLNDYRLALNVDERDIPYLQKGQEGSLLLKADPSNKIPFRIEQVSTVYQQGEGRIWYRAEASLTTHSAHLRPGMEGLAKVVVGEKSYLWLGFHRTLDWLRLRLWSWTP